MPAGAAKPAYSAIVGSTISLGGADVQVVGVMPPSFDYPNESVEVWQSLAFTDDFRASDGFRQVHYLRVVARVK